LAAGVVFLLSPNFLETNTDYAFFRCLYGFLVGHLVYRAGEVAPVTPRTGSILEAVAVALAVWFVLVAGDGLLSIAAPAIFGFVVWVFAQENGRVSAALKARPFVRLGLWSYSIYMVHWLVRNALLRVDPVMQRHFDGHAIPSWAMVGLLVGYLVLVVALAAATYALIEQPGRRLFNRMSDKLLAESAGKGENGRG
jgi:hypothetical protein